MLSVIGDPASGDAERHFGPGANDPLDPAPSANREELCDPAALSGRVAREMGRSASILLIGCGLVPSDSRDRQAR